MHVSNKKKKVVFITLTIPEYKKHLYCALDKQQNIVFKAFHGKEPSRYFPLDIGKINVFSNICVKNVYIYYNSNIVFAFQLLFFELIKYNPNIIILHDEVKIISNYFILLYAWIFRKKIIWYTHGENRKARDNSNILTSLVELIRLTYLKPSHAIITFTNGTKNIMSEKGINEDKIFISQNTLDIESMQKQKNRINPRKLKLVKEKLLLQNRKVICFIGRLTKEKMPIYFLQLIKELNTIKPDGFFGIMIGDGPLMDKIKKASYRNNIKNIYFAGTISIFETGKFLLNSDLVFIPGATGLSIVLSFCYGLPYVTFESCIHGPEIEYLVNGWNGLITTPLNYINDIYGLLSNDKRLDNMKRNALSYIADLTIDKQIGGFLKAINKI